MGSMSKKSKTQKRFFWPKSTFAQQLGLESIRGENLEFFQLKTLLKFFYGHFLRSKNIPDVLEKSGNFFEKPGKKLGAGKKFHKQVSTIIL